MKTDFARDIPVGATVDLGVRGRQIVRQKTSDGIIFASVGEFTPATRVPADIGVAWDDYAYGFLRAQDRVGASYG